MMAISGLYRSCVPYYARFRGLLNTMGHKNLYVLRPFARKFSDALWRSGDFVATRNILRLSKSFSFLNRTQLFLTRCLLRVALLVHTTAGEKQRLFITARIFRRLYRKNILLYPAACPVYFDALMRCNEFERLLQDIYGEECVSNARTNKWCGSVLLQTGHPTEAARFLERSQQQGRTYDWQINRWLGRCAALRGDYGTAARFFEKSVRIYPPSAMAHMNYAARYDIGTYRPQVWELEKAGELLVCDTLLQQAEGLTTMQGKFLQGLAVYKQWIEYQNAIAEGKSLPDDLQQSLARLSPRFRPELPTRILSYEWVVQFGHIGMLDVYIKRTLLGEIPLANHVLLAPKEKVANHAALACYSDLLVIVRDEKLVAELFPYQRYFGESFMATRGPEGTEPWSRAAARAYIQWAHQKRQPILKINFEDYAGEQDALRKAGVPEGAWYVGLHVREGGFYQESPGATNTYRNARIEDCMDAIREITARGGYVIRLGDPSMSKLPPMEHVIDYAHSPLRSERMDVFLLATTRFIIGTTSGLTSMAQAFGTPMMLINCISNDFQFWNAETDFMLKRIWSRLEKRYLSIGEAYRQPLRGALVQTNLIRKMGYEPHSNTPGEICAAVRYKLDMLEGKQPRMDETHPLIQRYRQEIAHEPYLFGAALPALPFLEEEAKRGLLPVENTGTPSRAGSTTENCQQCA